MQPRRPPRWPATWIALIGLVLPSAPVLAAGDEETVVRWLIPADGDLDGWRAAAAASWAGGLSVRRWEGAWPPTLEDIADPSVQIAFLEGPPQDGVLVLLGREGEGTLRLPLRFPGASDPDAMRSVLLILRSTAAPLDVAEDPQPPALLPPPADVEAAAAEVEAPPRRTRLRLGVGLGPSYRPGLDTAALAPRGRFGVALGPLERPPLRLLLSGGAEVMVVEIDAGGVPVRVDEGFLAAGLEVRPRFRRVQIPLALAGGTRFYRARRTDRDDPAVTAARPTLLLGGGPSWSLAEGARLELRLGASVELVRGEGGAPIGLEWTAGGQRVSLGLLPVRVGLELAVDLGEPAARRGPAEKNERGDERPAAAPTHTGAEG